MDKLWAKEADNRIEEYNNKGNLEMISAEEVFAKYRS